MGGPSRRRRRRSARSAVPVGQLLGDYPTRTGIDLPTRELLTFAILVSVGGADPQVKGHVAANLNAGNTRQDLLDATTVLLPFIGYPRILDALAAINEISKN